MTAYDPRLREASVALRYCITNQANIWKQGERKQLEISDQKRLDPLTHLGFVDLSIPQTCGDMLTQALGPKSSGHTRRILRGYQTRYQSRRFLSNGRKINLVPSGFLQNLHERRGVSFGLTSNPRTNCIVDRIMLCHLGHSLS